MIKLPMLSVLPLLAALAVPAIAQETRTFTDDLGRVVDIPGQPLRIVSLQDLAITVPLLELGVTPVGSHGRTTAEGVPFIRSSDVLTGVVAAFLSKGMPPLEAAAAAAAAQTAAARLLPRAGLVASDVAGALPRVLSRP